MKNVSVPIRFSDDFRGTVTALNVDPAMFFHWFPDRIFLYPVFNKMELRTKGRNIKKPCTGGCFTRAMKGDGR